MFMENTLIPKEKSSNKFFSTDFSQKLILLILGFLFTTILGGLLSYYFQAHTNSNNYKNSLIEAERKVAKDIFEDIITGIDERVYYAQIVNDDYSFNPNKKGVPAEKWSNYQKAMDQWNININRRFELMRFYFGNEAKKVMQVIHLRFINLNLKLRQAKTANNQVMHDNIKLEIATINRANADLSTKLIRLIQQDSVGRIPSLRK
jgi:hypothetical protein